MRPLKPTRLPQPATEAARTLQKKMGASEAYANRAVAEWRPIFSTRPPTQIVSSSCNLREGSFEESEGSA